MRLADAAIVDAGLEPSGRECARDGCRACTATALLGALLAAAWLLCAPAPACLAQGSGPAVEETVRITAQKFEFTPAEIVLAKGKPVILELTSLDRLHGFKCPGLGIRVDVEAGKTAKVSLTPDKAGRFPFFCDVFCGSGHEEMEGVIVVKE